MLLTSIAKAGFDDGKAAMMERDFGKAMAEFKPLAEKGFMKSLYIIGMMFDEGQGIKQDYA